MSENPNLPGSPVALFTPTPFSASIRDRCKVETAMASPGGGSMPWGHSGETGLLLLVGSDEKSQAQ